MMAKQLSRQIKEIESREKKGSYGSWKKEFCKNFFQLLIRIRNNTYQSLVDILTPKGEAITCRKGCTHCCFHYVTISLAQGIVIVDYLYNRKELLKQFIDNYEKWYRKGGAISTLMDRTRTAALASSKPIADVIMDTRPLAGQYLEAHIQCPFLVENKCVIYDVRPLSCSGHYSASPPDWCVPSAKREPLIHQIIPKDEDLVEMVRLSDPQLVLFELTLPIMIHRLLMEGVTSVMAEIGKMGGSSVH